MFKTIDLLHKVALRYTPSKDVFPIGISEFDSVMDGGIREGELIIISGKTADGKTLFAQNITVNLNKKNIPTLWFTFEMNPWYLNQRFIEMGQRSEDSLNYSPIKLIEQDLEFIDQEICEATDEAVKVVFIDHLHYLIPLNFSVNSSLMIGGVVRALKQIAIKRKVIIFLIAHTKKIYQDEKVDLSSIRDSSMISTEGDYVFLVERIKKESRKLEISGTEWTNKTRITLAKNRKTGKMIYITCLFQKNRLVPINDEYRIS